MPSFTVLCIKFHTILCENFAAVTRILKIDI